VSTSHLRDLLGDQLCPASLSPKTARIGVPRGSTLPAATTHVDVPSSECCDPPTYSLQLINLPLQLLLSVPLATCQCLKRSSRGPLLRQCHRSNQTVRGSIPCHIYGLFYYQPYAAALHGRSTNSKEAIGGVRSTALAPPGITQPIVRRCHVSHVCLCLLIGPD
jgi:hypothetical protein